MAYIPDIAILKQYEALTPAAAALFNYYCLKRNAKTGGWQIPKETVLRELEGICEPSYFRAKKELIVKGWISADRDFIRPLFGFEALKNESAGACETIKIESPGEEETIKNESQTIKNESATIKNESDIYKEIPTHLTKEEVPIGTPAADAATNDQAQEVFDYWRRTLNHPRSKFSRDKRRKIAARLREGFSVTELKRAVDGCRASAFHQGDNKDGRVHDGIDLICRNAEKVEMFVGIYEAKREESRPAFPTAASLAQQEAETLAMFRNQKGGAANV